MKRTPMDSTPTGSGIWGRLIRVDHPESPQLLTVLLAALVLVFAALAVALGCAWWIFRNGDLGSGACWALGLCIGALGALAGVTSKQSTQPPPPPEVKP